MPPIQSSVAGAISSGGNRTGSYGPAASRPPARRASSVAPDAATSPATTVARIRSAGTGSARRTDSPTSIPRSTGSASTAGAHTRRDPGGQRREQREGRRHAGLGVEGRDRRGTDRESGPDRPAQRPDRGVGQVRQPEEGDAETVAERRREHTVGRDDPVCTGHQGHHQQHRRHRGEAREGERPGPHPDPQPGRGRAPLGGQAAAAQHAGQRGGPCEQPGPDHRRPRLRRDLRRPGQQRAAEHGDRGVRARRPHQDRSAVVPEPAAEAPQRPACTQRDDGEQHGRRQQREHAERLARQHERDLVCGEPERDGRGEGPVERQAVARGPADGRGGRNEERVAREHRPHRGGAQDPQPGDAVGLGGDGLGGRRVGGGCEGATHAVQRRSGRRRDAAGTPT